MQLISNSISYLSIVSALTESIGSSSAGIALGGCIIGGIAVAALSRMNLSGNDLSKKLYCLIATMPSPVRFPELGTRYELKVEEAESQEASNLLQLPAEMFEKIMIQSTSETRNQLALTSKDGYSKVAQSEDWVNLTQDYPAQWYKLVKEGLKRRYAELFAAELYKISPSIAEMSSGSMNINLLDTSEKIGRYNQIESSANSLTLQEKNERDHEHLVFLKFRDPNEALRFVISNEEIFSIDNERCFENYSLAIMLFLECSKLSSNTPNVEHFENFAGLLFQKSEIMYSILDEKGRLEFNSLLGFLFSLLPTLKCRDSVVKGLSEAISTEPLSENSFQEIYDTVLRDLFIMKFIERTPLIHEKYEAFCQSLEKEEGETDEVYFSRLDPHLYALGCYKYGLPFDISKMWNRFASSSFDSMLFKNSYRQNLVLNNLNIMLNLVNLAGVDQENMDSNLFKLEKFMESSEIFLDTESLPKFKEIVLYSLDNGIDVKHIFLQAHVCMKALSREDQIRFSKKLLEILKADETILPMKYLSYFPDELFKSSEDVLNIVGLFRRNPAHLEQFAPSLIKKFREAKDTAPVQWHYLDPCIRRNIEAHDEDDDLVVALKLLRNSPHVDQDMLTEDIEREISVTLEG